MDNNGRHELKHTINFADYTQLRARLTRIAHPDKNASENGQYRVRSLYFDNYTDKAVVEKLSGLSRREKFRIRYYNDSTSFIKLEKKSKFNRLCYKQSAILTADQCEEIVNGNFTSLKSSDSPLLMELYTKIRYQNLRPRNIVDYSREAYIFSAGNVRITLDRDIRASNNVTAFLKPGIAAIPTSSEIILEIKFDGFMPEIIKDMIRIGTRNQTEFSKYVVSRFV